MPKRSFPTPGPRKVPILEKPDTAALEAEIERLQALVEQERRLAREATVRARQSEEQLERARQRIHRHALRELEQHKQDMLASFLEVLDDLDRALQAATGDDGEPEPGNLALVQGVELVRHRFLRKLGAFEVEPMSCLGHAFDPARHEAVSTAPVCDPERHGTIVSVVRNGYTVGHRVLRPAFVVVGKYASATAT